MSLKEMRRKMLDGTYKPWVEPTHDSDPENLSPHDLGWASVYLGGKFREYTFYMETTDPQFYEVYFNCGLHEYEKFRNQRKHNGPLISLLKDIGTAFADFYYGLVNR